LEKLAHEEKKHFQVLERRYDSEMRSEMWITMADVLNQEGLPEIDAQMAAKHRNLIADIHRLSTNREILEMALRLEEEARDLFVSLSGTAGSDDAKKVFKQLAGFEEGHVKLVQDLITEHA